MNKYFDIKIENAWTFKSFICGLQHFKVSMLVVECFSYRNESSSMNVRYATMLGEIDGVTTSNEQQAYGELQSIIEQGLNGFEPHPALGETIDGIV